MNECGFPEDEDLCRSRLFSFLSLGFSSLLDLLKAHFLQVSLPGLTLPCSNHTSGSLHFMLALHSSSIYRSLKCA